MTNRRWTAKVTVYNSVSDMATSQNGQTSDVPNSDYDLQQDMAKIAVGTAKSILLAGKGEFVIVQLYKTTNAGTKTDQSWTVERDKNGKVRATR